MGIVLLVLLVVFKGALPAWADNARSTTENGPFFLVSKVVDGDTLILNQPFEGAKEVRLAGIQAPKLSLGQEGFKEWPLAETARQALEDLVRGRRLTLFFGGRRMDRHGRLLAHLYGQDGLWIQGRLLERGMARVYSFSDNRALVGQMLSLERKARANGYGIWRHPFYAIRTVKDLSRRLGTFQLIEGTVLDAADVRGTVYLNFGSDWRTDFTIMIPKSARSIFAESGLALLSLKGKFVRVRGWLRKRGGPMIKATHPEQLEIPETRLPFKERSP